MNSIVHMPGTAGANDIEITLTWAELLLAADVGVMRNVQSMKLGRTPLFRAEDSWTSNIEGAAGEMAVAKARDRFWSGAIGNITADDVGPYQVKTNATRKWDDLMLPERQAKPDKIYISVLSFAPRFIITGWIKGSDAMQKQFRRAGPPFASPLFLVPRLVLNDMSTLPEL